MNGLNLFCVLSFLTFVSNAQTNTFPATGNVGIGTNSPGAKLSFNNVDDGTNGADGITWYSPTPLLYGIYRTPGGWVGPGYQQLKLSFATGIILDPGTQYERSFINVIGGGLRLPSSRLMIGSSSSPLALLQVTNSTSDNSLRLEAPEKGTSVSHVHHGTTGDWYIRSAHNTGKVVLQDASGSMVGIGTETPQAKLHIANGDVLLQNSSTGYPAMYFKDVSGVNSLRFDYNSIIHGGGSLFIRSGGTNPLLLNDAGGGNVGIGTQTPYGLLEIKGPYAGNSQLIINSTSSNAELRFSSNGTMKGLAWYEPTKDVMAFGRGNFSRSIVVNGAGNVGIGTSSPNEKLTVNGSIYSKEVRVDLSVPAPDYVFAENYPLPSLDDVRRFINEHKHLPDVPTARQMEKEGIEVGEMNMLLLKKIEELTLYMLELQAKVQEQEQQIYALQNK